MAIVSVTHGKWTLILDLLTKHYLPSIRGELLLGFLVDGRIAEDLAKAIERGGMGSRPLRSSRHEVNISSVPSAIFAKHIGLNYFNRMRIAIQGLDDLMQARAKEKDDFVSGLVKW